MSPRHLLAFGCVLLAVGATRAGTHPTGATAPVGAELEISFDGTHWTGEPQRAVSSTAAGSRPRSAFSSANSSGSSASLTNSIPNRLVVVSLPATSRISAYMNASSSVSSPVAVAARNRLSRSSAGSPARRRISASTKLRICT